MSTWSKIPELQAQIGSLRTEIAKVKRIASDRTQTKEVRREAQGVLKDMNSTLRSLQGQVTQLRWERWFKRGG